MTTSQTPAPPAVPPETKNWTWVLERACPDCGFDGPSFARAEIPRTIARNAARWTEVLARADVRTRPEPTTWSPLEYACHVRDVLRLYDYRLGLMRSEDDPLFPNWDQDDTAVAERYDLADPPTVSRELNEAAATIAASFGTVCDDDWQRRGRRSDDVNFTIESFATYFTHDPVHHLWDVTGLKAADH